MWNDLRLAVRTLARDGASSLAAALTLALGLAATTTMFTILHAVYVRDLPFPDPDRIVSIGTRDLTRGPDAIDNMSFPDLQDLRASARLFDGIVAADEEAMDLADAVHAPERITGAWVSADTFAVIGHRPVLGRDFVPDDDRPGAEPVVILGYDVWTRRYGADPGVIGRTVRVNGRAATVVGVMPDGFGFPTGSRIWQPLALRGGDNRDERGARNIDVFGRLSAGATIDAAEADLANVMERLAREFPATNANVGAIVRPFRDLTTSGPIRIVFTGLTAAASLLLLIACVNVGNLLLARGAARAREITVRVSLGATRRRIIGQLLVESLLLAIVAAAVGLLGAAAGVRAFQLSAVATGAPYWVRVQTFDGSVIAFVAAACIGTAVLCGLAPALYASKPELAAAIARSGRSGNRRWADVFVVAQLTMSLVMMTAAGLWMRNVYAFSQLDAGVNTTGAYSAQVVLPAARYPNADDRRAFFQRLREEVTSRPGVQAGITSAAPLRGASRRGLLLNAAAADNATLPTVSTVAVGAGYLEVLGLAPVRGRLFTALDESSGADAIVVNERFAELHFPGESPVGRVIRLAGTGPGAQPRAPLTIRGVVPNVRQASPRQESVDARTAEPVVYTLLAAEPGMGATLMLRSPESAGAVAAMVRDALAAIDPDIPLPGGIVPFREAMNQELALFRVFGSMFGLFAAAALGLTTLAIYALVAYGVTQRMRELGVRMALGARARHVCWTVVRRACAQLGAGIVLGLAGALAVGQVLQGLLSGVSGRDPVTLIGVSVLLVLVALAACARPAWRAMRLDPAIALRQE